MFDDLSEKLSATFKRLRGHARLTEANIEEALREVRMSLLAADVNFKVVKDFVEHVKTRAVGADVLKTLDPAHQFVKIVHEELIKLLGGQVVGLNLQAAPPVTILICGLQGSGKTTSTAKLALHLRKLGRSPYLCSVDVYRPAAIDQLRKLGAQLDVPVHPSDASDKPELLAAAAIEQAKKKGHDVILFDTAGRLHVDEEMMAEVKRLHDIVKPTEVLFVADAMTGQDAVKVAEAFDKLLSITGTILTKLDGDARGGAALSIVAVTGKPIKFVGLGEKATALEPFHPDRMASRILDMGDMLTFIERAQEMYDEDRARALERKIRRDEFTLEDFRDSLQQVKKMGDMEGLLKMIPGMGSQLKEMKKMKGMPDPDSELRKVEAIINSMTRKERLDSAIINGSRRLRIAKGSGTKVEEVNRVLKQYLTTRKMMKRFKKMGFKGLRGLLPGF